MAEAPSEGESISLNHAREQTLEADVSIFQIGIRYRKLIDRFVSYSRGAIMILHSVTTRESTVHLCLPLAARSETDGRYSQSITTSLSESIYNYRHEYGRTYHGESFYPRCHRDSCILSSG